MADRLFRAPAEYTGSKVHVVVSQVTKDPVLAKIQKEQQQDTELADLIKYLENIALPNCEVRRQKVLTSAYHGYYVVDGILYFESTEVPDRRRLVVPTHYANVLWMNIMTQYLLAISQQRSFLEN